MNNDNTLLTQLDFLVTSEDVSNFMDELSQLEKTVFNVNEDAGKRAEEIFSHSKLSVMRPLMQQQGVDFSSKTQVKEFVESLNQALRKIARLKMVIACEPSEATLKEVSAWVKRNTNGKVILDIEVNPDIVGGAVIEFNGVYKDYSLRKKIADGAVKES